MNSKWPKFVACTSACLATSTYELLAPIGEGACVVLETVTLKS